MIRSQQLPHRTRPFIIAQTANVTEEYRRSCMESGMDLFVASEEQSSPISALIVKPHASQWLMMLCVTLFFCFLEPVIIEALVAALEAAYAYHAEVRSNARAASPDIPSHSRVPSAISLAVKSE